MIRYLGFLLIAAAIALWGYTNWQPVTPLEAWLESRGVGEIYSILVVFAIIAFLAVSGALVVRRRL